jgi:arsenite-transporting ATPase
MLRLAGIANDFRGRVIIDTAPTGHTLRFFELPDLALRWLDAFDAMERKHAAVALGLTGNYSADAPARFLERLRSDVQLIRSLLRNPSETRMVLVTTDEKVVVAETLRYQQAIHDMGIALGGIVVNGSSEPSASAGPTRMVFVPRLHESPNGLAGLRRFAAAVGQATRPGSPVLADTVSPDPFTPPLDRSLYMVGGKGGVGKTTAAAALAVHLATHGRRILLLSVDPAGSLAEVLGVEVESGATPAPGVQGLSVRQIDSRAAWLDYTDRYRQEVRGLFERVVSPGLSANVDRDVVERLIDLAPPGIDELVGLLEVVDSTEDRQYDALVVDTAPTGHLLRLLEMPEIALEWCHTLMRLLLRYRGAVRMGDVGEDLLRLSRRIRAFRERLADGRATWFLAVARPESLSVPETERLIERLRAEGVSPGALLINRILGEGRIGDDSTHALDRLMTIASGLPTILAPDLTVAPTGPAALGQYLNSWRLVAGAEATA